MKSFPYFQLLTLLMMAGSLVFFWECVSYLSRRDYVAAGMLTLIGLFTMWAGGELARLALAERSA
ncbi:MAG: hypothetical protein RMK29_09715 [Myxococcales bacterium]|nr:hypothetical protein [Myxococcota bacterium]MDW8281978.1 hypothetical protein [Myxococcales bacterium]